MTETKPERNCPDGGTCHHECPANPAQEPCFRTSFCAPFSSYNGGTQENPGHWKADDR